MDIATAIRLIRNGIKTTAQPQTWADLGAGDGLFTRAAASLLEADSTIYAIDKTPLPEIVADTNVTIVRRQKDFISDELGLTGLDGIIMANSLHYVRDQSTFLKKLTNILKPEGRILIVEYDLLAANKWVPYPVPFASLQHIADAHQFTVNKLETHPSVYHQADIYSALLIHQ